MRKKAIQLISGNVLNTFLRGILTIYVARILGPSDQGILALAMGSALLFSMALNFGVPHATAYFIRQRSVSVSKILFYLNSTLFYGFFISTGLLFLGRGFFSAVFLEGKNVDSLMVFLLIGIILLNSNNTMLDAGIIAKGDSKKHAFSLNIGTITSFLVILVLVNFTSWRIHGVLLGYLIGYVVTGVMFRMVFSEYMKNYIVDNRNILSSRVFFGFGLKAQIGSVASFFFKRVDLFVAGYFLNTTAVGYYSVGLGLRDIALIVARAMAGLIGGEMADEKSKINGTGIRLFKKGIWLNVVFSILVIIGSIFIFPAVIPFVYGVGYENAVLVSILIMVSLLPLSVAIIAAVGLPSYGKPMHMSFGTVFAASLGVISVWYLTKFYGIIGTGLSSIFACTILAIVHLSLFWFFILRVPNYINFRSCQEEALK